MSEKSKKISVCALAGITAGIINGLFGSAGGMALVIIFVRFLKMKEKTAFATAVYVTLFLSAVSTIVYLIRFSSDIYETLPFVVGGIVGGIAGGIAFKKIPVIVLRRIFALFILWAAYRSVML